MHPDGASLHSSNHCLGLGRSSTATKALRPNSQVLCELNISKLLKLFSFTPFFLLLLSFLFFLFLFFSFFLSFFFSPSVDSLQNHPEQSRLEGRNGAVRLRLLPLQHETDRPVPLTDSEKWRSFETALTVFISEAPAFIHIFSRKIHRRSCPLIWLLPYFKYRKKETDECHKDIKNIFVFQESNFPYNIFLRLVKSLASIIHSSTLEWTFLRDQLLVTYFIMSSSIASDKWSVLVSRVPTKQPVVNPPKVNEAWNYSHFCVMASLQPFGKRHLCGVSCRETTSIQMRYGWGVEASKKRWWWE